MADDEDALYRRLARFEEGVGHESQPWLGGPGGLAVGIGATLGAAGVGAVTLASFSAQPFVTKLCWAAFLLTVTGVAAFWRRQRLAAHFQAAHRLLGSDDADARQRGLTELLVNARRGWGEHKRIAGALTEYLRRPPYAHPQEAGRRQLAFTVLADATLTVHAKERLDLTGAVLAGIRGVSAELPGVCLRGADLTGARLARANLERADLQDARLDGADLTGARLDGTILARAS